jgi:hypothetical protein
MTRRPVAVYTGSAGRSGQGIGGQVDLLLTATASALLAAVVFFAGAAIPLPPTSDALADSSARALAQQYPCDWPDEWELCADPLRWPNSRPRSAP